MCFFCRHVRTVTLVTMQTISDDMLTTSKICVGLAKREWALTITLTAFGQPTSVLIVMDFGNVFKILSLIKYKGI